MIEVSSYVSGTQLGSLLAADAEEFAYALVALAKEADDDGFAQEVAETLYEMQPEIVSFLRRLADAIERR
jgi:hypothetical protein